MGTEKWERRLRRERMHRRNGGTENERRRPELTRPIEDELSSPFNLRCSVSPVNPCPPHPPCPRVGDVVRRVAAILPTLLVAVVSLSVSARDQATLPLTIGRPVMFDTPEADRILTRLQVFPP